MGCHHFPQVTRGCLSLGNRSGESASAIPIQLLSSCLKSPDGLLFHKVRQTLLWPGKGSISRGNIEQHVARGYFYFCNATLLFYVQKKKRGGLIFSWKSARNSGTFSLLLFPRRWRPRVFQGDTVTNKVIYFPMQM